MKLVELIESFNLNCSSNLDKANEVLNKIPLNTVAKETMLGYQTLYKLKTRESVDKAHKTTLLVLSEYYDRIVSALRGIGGQK